jgi:hypothetical protein
MLGKSESAGMPSLGFYRGYPACSVIGDEIFSGTDSGEIVVYSIAHKVYRMHKRVCSGAVLSFAGGKMTPD